MNCAKLCKKGFLTLEEHDGVSVMQCHWCKGFWLDRNDIDELADVVFSEKWLNNSLAVSEKETKWVCHHCGYKLREVEYFEEGVRVGFCPEGHGWWFENGKKAELSKFMTAREKGLQKGMETKKSWKDYLRAIKSGEYINHLSGHVPEWWDEPTSQVEIKKEEKIKKREKVTVSQEKSVKKAGVNDKVRKKSQKQAVKQ